MKALLKPRLKDGGLALSGIILLTILFCCQEGGGKDAVYRGYGTGNKFLFRIDGMYYSATGDDLSEVTQISDTKLLLHPHDTISCQKITPPPPAENFNFQLSGYEENADSGFNYDLSLEETTLKANVYAPSDRQGSYAVMLKEEWRAWFCSALPISRKTSPSDPVGRLHLIVRKGNQLYTIQADPEEDGFRLFTDLVKVTLDHAFSSGKALKIPFLLTETAGDLRQMRLFENHHELDGEWHIPDSLLYLTIKGHRITLFDHDNNFNFRIINNEMIIYEGNRETLRYKIARQENNLLEIETEQGERIRLRRSHSI